jgi:hypothetical protein
MGEGAERVEQLAKDVHELGCVVKDLERALASARRQRDVAEYRIDTLMKTATDFIAADPELCAVTLEDGRIYIRKEILEAQRAADSQWVPLKTYQECRLALAFARALLLDERAKR